MTQRADIRKIQKEGARIKKQQERLTARSLKLAEDTKSHAMAIECLIVAQMREAGLMQLPLTRLLEDIKSLGRTTGVPMEEDQDVRQIDEENAETREPSGLVQGSDVDRNLSVVTVKISSNVSDKNRSVLEASRLTWNGKLGFWKGHADEATIKVLREHFDEDRVKVRPRPSPDTDERGLKADPSPKPVQPSSGPAEAPLEPSVPTTDAVESPSDAEPTTTPDIAEAGGNTSGTAKSPTNPPRRPPIGLPRRPAE